MDALDAAISASNAAWWGAGASALAALATVLAVWSAFRLQRKQLAADRILFDDQIAEARRAAAVTEHQRFDEAAGIALDGFNLIRDLRAVLEEQGALAPLTGYFIRLDDLMNAVAYYTARELPHRSLVTALTVLRPILQATLSGLQLYRGRCDQPSALGDVLAQLDERIARVEHLQTAIEGARPMFVVRT